MLLIRSENEKTTANAIGEGYDSSDATAATPTLTRRNGDAIVSDDTVQQTPSPVNLSDGNHLRSKYSYRLSFPPDFSDFTNLELRDTINAMIFAELK